MNENVPAAWDLRVAYRKQSSKTINQYLENKN